MLIETMSFPVIAFFLDIIYFCSCIFKSYTACCCAESFQSCATLWPHGLYPPGSSVHDILQARISPCPPPGDLSDPGIEPKSLALAGGFFTTCANWEAPGNQGSCQGSYQILLGPWQMAQKPTSKGSVKEIKYIVLFRLQRQRRTALWPCF